MQIERKLSLIYGSSSCSTNSARDKEKPAVESNGSPPAVGDARVPRLPPSLTEQHRLVAQMCSSSHPQLFRENFRVERASFERLQQICEPFIDDSVRSKRELLVVTLHWLGTGTVARQQETKFQLGYSTCQQYRVEGIQAVTAALSDRVRLPTEVPEEFAQRFPHFNQTLGAVDVTHVEGIVAAVDANEFRSRKTTITTNVLIFSNWNLYIRYVHAGAEGSAHDSLVLSMSGLCQQLPPDYHVLADAGYGLTVQVLTQYRGVRYHLHEGTNEHKRRPKSPKELYNLHHSTARNVVERAIGVLKRRFTLLRIKNESELETAKVAIFSACCVHKFIRECNADILAGDLDEQDDNHEEQHARGQEDVAESPIPFDFESATAQRDYIAREMWLNYRTALRERRQRV